MTAEQYRNTLSYVFGPGISIPTAFAPVQRTDGLLSVGTSFAGITAALNAMAVMPVFLPPALHEGYVSYVLTVLKPAMHNVVETGTRFWNGMRDDSGGAFLTLKVPDFGGGDA